MHFTRLAAFLARLLATTLGNTTNVECPHGELCTRLTNGLRRDDANRFTLVHQCTAGQVTTITGRTDAIFRFTGQRRPDQHGNHTIFFDKVRFALVDDLTFGT